MSSTPEPSHPRDHPISPLRLLSAYLTTDHPTKPTSPQTPPPPKSASNPTVSKKPVECQSHRIDTFRTQILGNLEFALALSKNERLKIVTMGDGKAIVVALGYSVVTGECDRWMAVMEVDGVDGVDGWEEALERSEEAVRGKLGELRELARMVLVQEQVEEEVAAEKNE